MSRLRSPTFQPGSWGCVLGGTRVGGVAGPSLENKGLLELPGSGFTFYLTTCVMSALWPLTSLLTLSYFIVKCG